MDETHMDLFVGHATSTFLIDGSLVHNELLLVDVLPIPAAPAEVRRCCHIVFLDTIHEQNIISIVQANLH